VYLTSLPVSLEPSSTIAKKDPSTVSRLPGIDLSPGSTVTSSPLSRVLVLSCQILDTRNEEMEMRSE
jgi:hypothetical protein